MICLPSIKMLMELSDFSENCDEIKIFIMEKPNVNILPDKTKYGIHLIMGFRDDKEVQKEIRKLVLDRIKNETCCKLPLNISWDDVIDKAITNGSNNWQLLGSRKPGHEAYEVTKIYAFTKDTKFTYYELNEEVQYYWPLVSAQNKNLPIFKPKNKNPPVRSIGKRKKRTIQEITPTIYEGNVELNEDGLTKDKELLYMIRIEPKNRKMW
jgi:hypothetical protein